MKHFIMYAVIFFNCSHYNQLVDSDPYAILDQVDSEDILVFEQNCDPDPYAIKTFGPEGLSAMDDGPGPEIESAPQLYFPYIFKPSHVFLKSLFQ